MVERTDVGRDVALRTIELDGHPWFHATDVCRCLGLSINGGTYHHLRKLDADEKRTLSKSQNRVLGEDKFLGRAATATVVSESGIYKLTMRADSDKAKPFQDWVTREVLPAIRKTGGQGRRLLRTLGERTPDAATHKRPVASQDAPVGQSPRALRPSRTRHPYRP